MKTTNFRRNIILVSFILFQTAIFSQPIEHLNRIIPKEKISASRIVVNTTADTGPGSLRDAIEQSNTNFGPDSIVFQISTSDLNYDSDIGVWTIKPLIPLPVISDSFTVIDGFSQTDFAGDRNPYGLEIELNGSETTGSIAHGLFIMSSKNIVQGLAIHSFLNSGILLTSPSANENKIINNFIGVNASVNALYPNGTYGVYIVEGARNQIGSIELFYSQHLNKKDKISIQKIHKNSMQQYEFTGQNIIAGNLDGGIYISGQVANDNQIINNQIIFNGSHGIFLSGWVSRTMVFWNAIVSNEGAGVLIKGENAIQNTITTNLISGNDSLGIILDGGNNMIPAPDIYAVTDTSIIGIAPSNAVIELFGDPEDEGELLLGSTLSDASGNFSWSGFVTGSFITATATDENGNTSQFSEPVRYLGILLVTTTSDSGKESLRQALEDANDQIGRNTIQFQIPIDDQNYNTDTGVWTIQPKTPLPRINDDHLLINGYSQAEFIGLDTNPEGPEIEIDGSLAGSNIRGLDFFDCSDISVYGLIINRFDYAGINLSSVNNGIIVGCYLGTDTKGIQPLGNKYGIYLYETQHVLVGALDSTSSGNLISGNSVAGIALHRSSKHNFIVGNYIGTNLNGAAISESNFNGIYIYNASDSNQVLCNRIGCSQTHGIYIEGNSNHNIIGSNEIGTDATWQLDIGNQNSGILVYQSSQNQILNNLIGYNGVYGVSIYGAGTNENTISQNEISKNTRKGIENDNGGNMELSPPTIQSINSTHVEGTAGPMQTIEIFIDEADQGQIYFGNTTTDVSGNFTFQFSEIPQLPYFTATSTDSAGNTSEFSAAISTETIVEQTPAIPEKYQLYQNFPNPFNPITTIQFDLPKSGFVVLKVYNLLGKEVYTLISEYRNAGEYEVQWNAKDFSSGIYLLRLEVGDFVETKKLIVQK